jgi:diguanylate cyclase (GGDEF)-like protein/PAS domain S-box-containing protein
MRLLVKGHFPGPSMSLFHDPDVCRSILDSLPSGMAVVDMQKRIVFWSDAAERITGHLRHEVIGHSCISESLLHCDQPSCEFCKEDCPAARAIKTSHPAEAIGFLHHKAGYELPVRIHAVPVHNQHGSIIGAVEIFEELQPAASHNRSCDNLTLSGGTDEITSVASHALMQAHLRRTLASFIEFQVPFGILCLRLEGLAHFRASLGTEAASSLLRVVARSLESTFWATDMLGRWSDDQFLVILNGCREEALDSVRERIRRILANDGIEWWGERHSLPVCIGWAAAQSDDTFESLITRVQKSLEADSAWRTASGSNCSKSTGS